MVLKKGIHVVGVPPNVSNAVASPANCALATMVHAVSYATSNTKIRQSVAIIQVSIRITFLLFIQYIEHLFILIFFNIEQGY